MLHFMDVPIVTHYVTSNSPAVNKLASLFLHNQLLCISHRLLKCFLFLIRQLRKTQAFSRDDIDLLKQLHHVPIKFMGRIIF